MILTNENFIHIANPNQGGTPFLAFNTLEVVDQLALKKQVLKDNLMIAKLRAKKLELERILCHLPFEEQAKQTGPFAALGAVNEILEETS